MNSTFGWPLLMGVKTSSFQVDRLYGPESTSDQIYDDLCGPLVPWAVSTYLAVIPSTVTSVS